MQKISIPITGYMNKEAPPSQLVGSLSKSTNWLLWKDMLMQPNGPVTMANATTAHSAIWYRDLNNNGFLLYTDGRDIKQIDQNNNTSSVAANAFSANVGNGRWPITRFYKHIMLGSANDGMHWFYPEGYNGTVTGKAGVVAPANAATSVSSNNAGNGITGIYKLVYTYVNAQSHESAPSPESDSICVYDHGIVWGNVAVGPAGTLARKLYRTVNDGALFLHLTTLNDNTTTTYNDNTSDTSLGSEVDFQGSDAPPEVIRGMCVAGSRLYLLDDAGVIWASKIDPQTSLPNWEAFPAALSCTLPAGESSDKIQNIFSLNETVFAATRSRIYRLMGDPYTGQRVVKVAEIGLFNRWSWCYLLDSDIRYVCLLTSNYKVVKMDMSGEWKDIGADIFSSLKGISNYKAPDLGDSVDMLHDTSKNVVTMHCASNGYNNHITYVLDLNSGKWSGPIDWGFLFSLTDDTGQRYIGYEKGSRLVSLSANSYQKDAALGTYYNNQCAQTYPFFLPDKQMVVGRVGIVCRSLPIVNYIPPMLKVEWAINNNDKWQEKFVDVSNVPFRYGNVGNSLVSREAITVYIPVHATVSSLAIRITALQNAAAVQGFEIYDIFAEVDEAEEMPAAGRDIDKDRR
jgi:hypothetical protein